MRAYDIEKMSHDADRTDPGNQGWRFGLPPGISTKRCYGRLTQAVQKRLSCAT